MKGNSNIAFNTFKIEDPNISRCFDGSEWNKYSYDYFIPKGSTSTLIESGVYYSPYAGKKYQDGNYTAQSYAFGKLIAEEKFTITN